MEKLSLIFIFIDTTYDDDKNEHGHNSVIQLSFIWSCWIIFLEKAQKCQPKTEKCCRLFGMKIALNFSWRFLPDAISTSTSPNIPHFYGIHHKKWKSIKWQRLLHLHSITSLPPLINKREIVGGSENYCSHCSFNQTEKWRENMTFWRCHVWDVLERKIRLQKRWCNREKRDNLSGDLKLLTASWYYVYVNRRKSPWKVEKEGKQIVQWVNLWMAFLGHVCQFDINEQTMQFGWKMELKTLWIHPTELVRNSTSEVIEMS